MPDLLNKVENTTMNLAIFHLQARGAFHFGLRGVGIEESTDYAPSDTLFNALCTELRIIESREMLETMLTAFVNHQPPFLCSGGYPYVLIGDTPLRFYPVTGLFAHDS